MRRSEFLIQLQKGLSQSEWEALAKGRPLAPVSMFNQGVLLEMRDVSDADGEISIERATGLYETLRVYLSEYMAEQPEGWKYIILASLYLVFIAGRPMHPIDRLGIEVVETSNGPIYLCPMKSAQENTACGYCVCRRRNTSNKDGKGWGNVI